MDFGEILKELREDKGLRQEDVGAIFGFGKSTVSQWENGKSQPEFSIVIKLAEFFDVSIDYLMGRKTEQVIYQRLTKNLNEEDIKILEGQADYLRHKKTLPEDARDGLSGLTESGKSGNSLNFKRGRRKRA